MKMRKAITVFQVLMLTVLTLGLDPGLKAQATIDDTEKKAVIESLISQLDRTYVYPKMAQKMGKLLNSKLKDGKYKTINSTIDFAEQLTADLQSISHDKHLRVNFNPDQNQGMRLGQTEEDEEENQRRQAAFEKQMRRSNYGFKEVKILEGNVGYLDLRGFMNPAQAGETAASAMNVLKNTEAIIIDLRRNGGGSPQMIQLLTSYLYDANNRVHLNSFYFRPSNDTTQTWTLPYVPGTRNPNAEVFVLTSNYTFSAAEEFTYNLKNLERATIVGETTGGGAHPGGMRPVAERFVAFIPVGRAINPITNTNWEGVGVIPNVEVPQEKALKVAHQLAMEKLSEKAEDDTDKRYFKWYSEHFKAENEAVMIPKEKLKSYAGNYGARNMKFEEGQLYYQREGRPKMKLLAINETTFAIIDNPGLRFEVEIKDDQAVALILHRVNGPSERNQRTNVKP